MNTFNPLDESVNDYNKRHTKQPEDIAVTTSNHPKRETIICQDDINNLIIALNTTKTVNQFLKKV